MFCDTTLIQVSRIRYHQIADDLRRRIASGEWAAGQVLPSEAALGTEHDASRVTIRKALELLRSEGLVDSRQGFGWLVAAETLPQPLASLVTIEQQLEASGRQSARRVLDFRFVDAPPLVKQHLGRRVLEVRRLNLADGEPFARVTVWCREDLGASLSKADVERASFYELLDRAADGDELGRSARRIGDATQTIGAENVSSADAELLGVPTGTAVLVVRRVTNDLDEVPVLVSEHVFPGHLTEFVVELARADGSDLVAPPGLRLVGERVD